MRRTLVPNCRFSCLQMNEIHRKKPMWRHAKDVSPPFGRLLADSVEGQLKIVLLFEATHPLGWGENPPKRYLGMRRPRYILV